MFNNRFNNMFNIHFGFSESKSDLVPSTKTFPVQRPPHQLAAQRCEGQA